MSDHAECPYWPKDFREDMNRKSFEYATTLGDVPQGDIDKWWEEYRKWERDGGLNEK